MKTILIKYHDRKMLSTIDHNVLVATLLNAFGNDLTLEFLQMSEFERDQSSSLIEEMVAVHERLWLFEKHDDVDHTRLFELERVVARESP